MTTYQQQLRNKTDYPKRLFQGLDFPKIEVFGSPEQHYRVHAEFRIWHEDGEMLYVMLERGQKTSGANLIRCDQFPAASEFINALISKLIEAATQNPELKNHWYAAEFLSALSGEMLVTMIYHKKLGEAWQHAAEILARELGIHIIGRSRGQKIVLTQGYIAEELSVNDETFRYRQVEGSFTQPNARVYEKMLGWACGITQNLSGDLLELYCGNGNFTLPLLQYFRQVLVAEVSKTPVYAVQWNIETSQRGNIEIVRLSAEESIRAYTQGRGFRRLQEQGILLEDYVFPAIFVDPSHVGVDEETLKLVSQFDNIIYIPRNPEVPRANLNTLRRTHTVKRAALFDQFPLTHHIESGVRLERKLK